MRKDDAKADKNEISNIKETKDNASDKLNVGISLLRIWMIFEVMIIHFSFDWCRVNAEEDMTVRVLQRYEYVAVPVFILLAFMLSDYKGMAADRISFRKRMYRLLLPNIFWAVVYYIVLFFIGLAYHEQIVHGISDLLWQLLFGHVYNKSLWFQTVLILSTLIVVALFRFAKKHTLIILFFISLISLYLQYSGINSTMFDNIPWPSSILGGQFSGDYIMYTLGRGIEILPYVFLGGLAAYFGLFEKLRKYRGYVIVVCLALTVLFFTMQIFIVPFGFMYGGLGNMALAVTILMLFYYLPLEKLPSSVKKVIHLFARYTMAVYFMHQLVKWIYTLVFHIPLFDIFHPMLANLIIYLSCIGPAILLSKIPIRFIRDSVM